MRPLLGAIEMSYKYVCRRRPALLPAVASKRTQNLVQAIGFFVAVSHDELQKLRCANIDPWRADSVYALSTQMQI